MQGTKRQHTVAQSYLARFTADGSRFFAFDKGNGKVFPTSVKDVAVEAYFYELPADIMSNVAAELGAKDQYLEKILAAADGYAKTQIDETLEEVQRRPISAPHRAALANVMALQVFRTMLNRQLLRECYHKLTHAITEDLIQRNYPNEAKHCGVRVEFDEDTWVIVQARQMLDEDQMVRFATILAGHIWIFGINNTPQPFYTSDQPVAKTAHCASGGVELTGFGAPGIEIVYPLTSKYVLYLLERRVFRQMQVMDGRAMVINLDDVEHFNALQVRKSFRQVYCETDQFNQARDICNKHPECCDPKRKRVEVVDSESHLITMFLE